MVAVLADGLHQPLGAGAGDGRLTGRVDVGDEQHVGLVEGAGEVVEQVARPAVTVRLEGHDDPVPFARVRPLGGLERGADLRRVVAVVVDEGHAADGRR